VFCSTAILGGYAIARLTGRLVIREAFNDRGYFTGAFIQGGIRSNFIIIGYPVLLNLFGDAAIVNIALITLIFIPLTNILSIIALMPPSAYSPSATNSAATQSSRGISSS